MNPYHNRDITNRNIRFAEQGARIVATITTSLGAFIWGQDLAMRYLPLEWSATPFLAAATGILAGGIMGYLTDFMFGNLLQRVTYDTLAASHPNVVQWQGPTYFKRLRNAEKVFFTILLVGLLIFDLYTTIIIRDPIADNARQTTTTDIAAATDTIATTQRRATADIADQIKTLQKKIKDDESRAANANPALTALANRGNAWARQQIATKKERATRTARAQLDAINNTYNQTLASASTILATTQNQIAAQNDQITAQNQRSRNVMAGMYVAFTVIPKILSIILRILMVITFLAYSVNFNPDLTGDGVIDYLDVEEYYRRQKENHAARIAEARKRTAPPPATDPDTSFT